MVCYDTTRLTGEQRAIQIVRDHNHAEQYDAMKACLLNLYDKGIVMECDGDAFNELEDICDTLKKQ